MASMSSSTAALRVLMLSLSAVSAGTLLTPRLHRCGVRGVMRRVVLEHAGNVGLDARETDLLPSDLAQAEELFVTNAVFGIKPVRELDGRAIPVGPTTRALIALLGVAPDA